MKALRRLVPILLAILSGSSLLHAAGALVVRTFAESGFFRPGGVTVDPSGNVFVCDGNNTIRKITPRGEVTTLAGAPGVAGARDGAGSAALFGGPHDIASDSQGNLFVTDNPNFAVRKITPAGVVTTFAGQLGVPGSNDGLGTAAHFNYAHDLAIDALDNIYVADTASQTIRKITPAGVVTTFAGRAGSGGHADGPANVATFNFPSSIAVDSSGNVWVGGDGLIRRIGTDGMVTTVAGASGVSDFADGPAQSARFAGGPEGLAFDAVGNLLISDSENQVIRSMTPDGVVSTVAGSPKTAGNAEGAGSDARLNNPGGIARDGAGRLYFADRMNDIVRFAMPLSSAPSVAVSSPVAGAPIYNGSPIRIAVSNAVLDCTGSPAGARWQLLVDGAAVATSCTATLRLTHSLGAGAHELTARLLDADGQPLLFSSDARVTVTVLPDPVFDVAAVVPGQARAPGASGSFFRSTEWLINSSDQPTVVRLAFVPGSGFSSGGISRDIPVAIPPHESVAFRDILFDPFEATENTSGNVVLSVGRGMSVPVVAARTFNDTPAGTFGQYIRPAPLGGNGSEVWIHGLSADSASRSNLGVVNLSTAEAHVEVALFAADGRRIGNAIPVDVGPWSSLQLSRVNAAAGVMDAPLFSARVTAREGNIATFTVYASKLDNVTSDPIFITPLGENTEQWIDGVGAVHGAGGTLFKSTLVLANRNEAAASVHIAYTLRASVSPVAEKSVTIPPGASVIYGDAVNELFARPETAGTLRIDASVPIVAWARTYNDRGSDGTLGQFIPAFDRSALIGSQGALLPGLSDNAAFRTNFGAVNVSSSDTDVRVEVFDSDGTKLGERAYGVRSGEAIFVSRFLAAITGRTVEDVYVRLTPAVPGAIYAWASFVDGTSTDQTFVRPVNINE